MQTFLPYPDFRESARVLDRKRLGKQRVEALQIYWTIAGVSNSWRHHPAILMWDGYETALAQYYSAICAEWEKRGYVNNMPRFPTTTVYRKPPWLGDEDFHRSHRSNLLRKDWDHYSQYFQDRTDLPYVWPIRPKGKEKEKEMATKKAKEEKVEAAVETPAELIGTMIVANEKGKLPRGLRRCMFVEGKTGDDLFLDYLERYAQARYERSKAQIERWIEKESARIDELRDRYAGVTDPKKAISRQIERLQKKLMALQNSGVKSA